MKFSGISIFTLSVLSGLGNVLGAADESPETFLTLWSDDEIDHCNTLANATVDDVIGSVCYKPFNVTHELYLDGDIAGVLEKALYEDAGYTLETLVSSAPTEPALEKRYNHKCLNRSGKHGCAGCGTPFKCYKNANACGGKRYSCCTSGHALKNSGVVKCTCYKKNQAYSFTGGCCCK